MAQVSVAEAAQRLDVHVQRVHQRIADGSLPAVKVGHQWVIEEGDIERLGKRPPGRPLSAQSAWDIVALAHDKSVHLPSPRRSVAERRLKSLMQVARDRDEDRVSADLLHILRNHAERSVHHVSPRDLPDLRQDARLHLSGISHPDSGIASGAFVEAYVSPQDLAQLVDDYLLVPASADSANVILHAIDGAVVPPVDGILDSRVLLAADLAEHHQPRESARSVDLLREFTSQNGRTQ